MLGLLLTSLLLKVCDKLLQGVRVLKFGSVVPRPFSEVFEFPLGGAGTNLRLPKGPAPPARDITGLVAFCTAARRNRVWTKKTTVDKRTK